ncbi:Uncharacterised protein [Mycobacteroides abscessus subsp. abscessus]|nr:Uncharacterised protein [Mycobacteroides abscessus subsp. abscessus]
MLVSCAASITKIMCCTTSSSVKVCPSSVVARLSTLNRSLPSPARLAGSSRRK